MLYHLKLFQHKTLLNAGENGWNEQLWKNADDFIISSKHTGMAIEINRSLCDFNFSLPVLSIFTHFSINTSVPGTRKREKEGSHKQVHVSTYWAHFSLSTAQPFQTLTEPTLQSAKTAFPYFCFHGHLSPLWLQFKTQSLLFLPFFSSKEETEKKNSKCSANKY